MKGDTSLHNSDGLQGRREAALGAEHVGTCMYQTNEKSYTDPFVIFQSKDSKLYNICVPSIQKKTLISSLTLMSHYEVSSSSVFSSRGGDSFCLFV